MNSRKRVCLFLVSEKYLGHTGEPDQRSETVSVKLVGRFLCNYFSRFHVVHVALIVSNQKSDSEITASSVESDRAHPTRWYRKGSPDPRVGDRLKSESC